MNNLADLIPEHKCDTESAQKLVDLGYPAVKPVLMDLLAWCQDINWPVALILAPFLSEIGEPVLDEIRKVLKTDDDVWKYWCISAVVDGMSIENKRKFMPELIRLATNPSAGERAEEVDLVAQEILDELD